MEIDDLLPSWERSLRAANKSPTTIEDYGRAARRYQRWAEGEALPTDVDDIARKDLERYFVDLVQTRAPATAESNYKFLQQFFRWLVDEGELDRSPMERLKRPQVPEGLVPIIPDEAIVALLKASDGKGFTDRRGAAIVRTLLDTGMRLGGLLSMTQESVDLDGQLVTITLKGGRRHVVPFGHRTADALDRYVRVRRRHALAHLPAFWIGQRGGLGKSGVERLITVLADRAGVGPIHPHQFRHTAAHVWLANEGGETDLMRIMGWTSRDMVSRYARSAADSRARDAHRRMALGDRL